MNVSINLTRIELSGIDNGSCGSGSLTGPLGLFVQGLLAFIAFSALIVKRFCEPQKERRPWIIWFFDTSKQAIGATVIHFSNVFLSELFVGDPCTWYIVSFLLDSTIGLLIICIGLKICLFFIKKRRLNHLVFGNYGQRGQCRAWSSQCLLYVMIVIIEKLLMTLLMLFDFWKHVRMFILYPVSDPTLRLIVVMFIIPLIVNALVFWVVDNYLKEKNWDTTDDLHYTTSVNSHDLRSPFSSFLGRHSDDKHQYSSVMLIDGNGDNEGFLSLEEDSGVDIIPSGVRQSSQRFAQGVNSPEQYCLLNDPASVART